MKRLMFFLLASLATPSLALSPPVGQPPVGKGVENCAAAKMYCTQAPAPADTGTSNGKPHMIGVECDYDAVTCRVMGFF